MLTQEYLKSILHYDHKSGVFHWISNGALAGSIQVYGYIHISIANRKYAAHRLAWLYIYEKFPAGQIDHLDHNRANNRIENLREVRHSDNGRNQKRRVDTSSGVTGVSFHKQRQKWHARIVVNYKKIHLGYFDSFEDAVSARKAANLLYGFHENHGT